jgi:DNA-binding GntR family transcriptional regulator
MPRDNTDAPAMPEAAAKGLNATIYDELRRKLVTGRLIPGYGFSTRSLAEEMGVSQTPVRDALSRLAGEGAVEIRSKRRAHIPTITAERFDDLLKCRLLLEPEAAADALPHITLRTIQNLRLVDQKHRQAIADGNIDAYLEYNYTFHFMIYAANGWRTLPQLVEAVWLQYGPMLGLANGQLNTAGMFDYHLQAIEAIAAGDEARLRTAIAADIKDGVDTIRRRNFGAR